MTATAITALQHRAAVEHSLRTLRAAAAHLNRPCTLCTCRPAAARALDLDPDCPGLAAGGDGCLIDTHLRGRMALVTGLGAHLPASSRQLLRATLNDAVEALTFHHAFTDDALGDLVAAGLGCGLRGLGAA